MTPTLPPAFAQIFPTPLDLAAFAWFLLAVVGYRLLARLPMLSRLSIVDAVQAHRVQWMRNMAVRDNRVLDTILLGSLGQGNAFFASTSVIAVGGLAAMLGSGEKVQALLESLPYVARSSPVHFELKMLLLIVIFVYAFFKFAWAFRLSHYTAIMIGSTPIASADNSPACDLHARRTARLVGIAADHSNTGLRSFYFAIAAMAWFFHPLLFVVATTWVLVILVRRDYFSRSRAILAGRWPA
jgi:uncharacterized membrane protein